MRNTHLTIVQGTPFRILVRVMQKDEDGILVPKVLTDSVIKLQARPNIASKELFLDLSSNSEGIIFGDEDNTFVIDLSSEKTSKLIWGCPNTKTQAVFHCEVEPPDGEDFRVLIGTLTLDPEVVR